VLDRISSAELVIQLAAIEGRPWAEWGRNAKPMTQNALARQIDKFQICPGTIRLLTGSTLKGYYREAFEEAFSVYIPPPTVTPSQVNNDRHFRDFQTVTAEKPVTVQKAQKPNNDGQCDGVTVAKPPLGEMEGMGARRCAHCDQPGNLLECHYGDVSPWLHRGCVDAWSAAFVGDIPPFLDRRGERRGAAA
jgi:Protein of unknown function (DUF3631)